MALARSGPTLPDRTLRLDTLIRLRWLAILSGQRRLELGASGGAHGSLDVVKAVMAGAHTVQMVSALLWANRNADEKATPGPRYQVNHAWGDGGHTGKHGGSIFPDVMRWLWKDYVPKE